MNPTTLYSSNFVIPKGENHSNNPSNNLPGFERHQPVSYPRSPLYRNPELEIRNSDLLIC